MRKRIVTVVAIVALCSVGLAADVRTDQKTRVQFAGMLGRMMNLFGGKAAREGVTSTVAVKGERKITSTENTSQIIDLSEEKVYDIDLKKKSYKVTTFAELRRQLQEAQRKAAEDARQQEPKEKPSEGGEPQKEVEVDFDVKDTSETKVINGFDTRQSIMTITVREKGKTVEQSGGLVLTSDMWLASDQPALKEVADFDRRYFEKVYGGLLGGVSASQMAAAMALYPMLKDGIDRMSKEGSKIEGTAIMTTLTFDAVKSAEQLEAEKKQDEPKARGGIGGMLGGLARKAAKKDDDQPKQRANFMTSTVEVLTLSTDVNAAELAIPAGFKESK
jgi:hypothetical protein